LTARLDRERKLRVDAKGVSDRGIGFQPMLRFRLSFFASLATFAEKSIL